jgi:hypothetical protein
MIHKIDPRQKRLFDPYQGLITPAGLKIIAGGWQGVFRHILLEKMPVTELATNFSKIAGASTKELYSMAGIVFLADFFGWTNLLTIENFQFRIDVKYALNADPGYFQVQPPVTRMLSTMFPQERSGRKSFRIRSQHTRRAHGNRG